MKVYEIFTSIQGESSYAGIPFTFVRLSGCNLKCSYCDTPYAFDEGNELSEDEIIREIEHAYLRFVMITGGEPLLQGGVYHIIKRLLDNGYRIFIETNGSLRINDIDKRAIVILDIKTPGSGMQDKMDLSNLDLLRRTDEVKFVITNRNDYEWSKEIINRYLLSDKCKILLSPAYGIMAPNKLARWMLDDKIQARLNLQMHKYIFGPNKKGV